MTKDKKYTPPRPEEDKKLQSNPHYWLYKVTREALDNKDHPLADMGHIWNRWACEGLSEEEREALGEDSNRYPRLSDFTDKKAIENHIQEKEGFKEWVFPFFNKNISFSETTWDNGVDFSEFIFRCEVNFYNTIFSQHASFRDAIFTQDAYFEKTNFKNIAIFKNTIFTGKSYFKNATFTGNADFFNAKFNQDVDFFYAEFNQDARFSNVKFNKNVDFRTTRFIRRAYFGRAIFAKNALFMLAIFLEFTDFENAQFMGNIINFTYTRFSLHLKEKSHFSFKCTIFQTKVNFSESEFHHLPNLTGTDFRAGINLDKVRFPSDLSLKGSNKEENRHCEEALLHGSK